MNDNENSIIIRFLNGFLNGCEYKISAERLLVVCVPEAEFVPESPLTELPEDTLLIPKCGKGGNFELIVPSEPEALVVLRELDVDGAINERAIELNKKILVGDLCFAIKQKNDMWDAAIISQAVVVKKDSGIIGLIVTKNLCSIFLTIGIFASIIIAIFIVLNSKEDRSIRKLNTLLAIEKMDYQLLQGRDGVVYVITRDQKQAVWVSQIIDRGGGLHEVTRVIYPDSEALRTENWLSDNYSELKFFKISFDTPATPVVWISSSRTKKSKGELSTITRELLKIIPYANKIQLFYIDDSEPIEQAKAGLSALGFQYVNKQTSDYIGFTVNGELNDSELIRLQSFVQNFYRKWGRIYIKFNINLRNDKVESKSFRYGDVQYAKSSDNEWFFQTKGE